MSETRDGFTQADGVEGVQDVNERANDDVAGSESSLSDGEFEDDKPPSLSVEDFPMPQTSHPPVASNVYSHALREFRPNSHHPDDPTEPSSSTHKQDSEQSSPVRRYVYPSRRSRTDPRPQEIGTVQPRK